MKVKEIFIPLVVLFIAASCVNPEKKPTEMNPFFESYNAPFGVPPFDKIKNKHFLPAIEEGIKQHQADIKKITDSDQAPDFANTIEALDCSGDLLTRVYRVFSNLKEANTVCKG